MQSTAPVCAPAFTAQLADRFRKRKATGCAHILCSIEVSWHLLRAALHNRHDTCLYPDIFAIDIAAARELHATLCRDKRRTEGCGKFGRSHLVSCIDTAARRQAQLSCTDCRPVNNLDELADEVKGELVCIKAECRSSTQLWKSNLVKGTLPLCEPAGAGLAQRFL